MNKQVRVRFAPSPTGPLHIGGVRTALYNYLYSRKNNGKFILRIEDTDQSRFVPGAEQYIIDSLAWCGITFDEGVSEGGPFAPYRQSERKDIYRRFALELIRSGRAYYAFDTPADLENIKQKFKSEENPNPQYDAKIRPFTDNSKAKGMEDALQRIENGEPYVIRICIPENEEIIVHDLIRGEVRVHSSVLDDKVLFKSDGMPTYHLANIVDDHLMEITHVIRGEEWLPSAPLHVILYKSFGWDPPQFAHLPLILKPDGPGKLSKRDGDRMGFPVFPLQWTDPATGDVSSGYRESGYLPDAFINMLALLGWNPGTEQEIFSMEELISLFSIDKVGKAGSRFDPDKAKWFNHTYMQRTSEEDLVYQLKNILYSKGYSRDENTLLKIIQATRERFTLVPDIWKQTWFFFEKPVEYDQEVIKKRWTEQSLSFLTSCREALSKIADFSHSIVEFEIKKIISDNGFNTGNSMNILRLALVGGSFGPGIYQIIDILGQNETIERIEKLKAYKQ